MKPHSLRLRVRFHKLSRDKPHLPLATRCVKENWSCKLGGKRATSFLVQLGKRGFGLKKKNELAFWIPRLKFDISNVPCVYMQATVCFTWFTVEQWHRWKIGKLLKSYQQKCRQHVYHRKSSRRVNCNKYLIVIHLLNNYSARSYHGSSWGWAGTEN